MMTTSQPDPQGSVRTACNGLLRNPTGYPTALYRDSGVYFCTLACRRVFAADPDRFMAGEIEHPTQEDPVDPDSREPEP